MKANHFSKELKIIVIKYFSYTINNSSPHPYYDHCHHNSCFDHKCKTLHKLTRFVMHINSCISKEAQKIYRNLLRKMKSNILVQKGWKSSICWKLMLKYSSIFSSLSLYHALSLICMIGSLILLSITFFRFFLVPLICTLL